MATSKSLRWAVEAGGSVSAVGTCLRGCGPEAWRSVDGGCVAGLDAFGAKTSEESVSIAGVGDGKGAELAVVLERET